MRTLDLGPLGEEIGPPLAMKVVRKNLEGMGLSLEQSASANLESLSAEHIRQHTVLQSLFIVNRQDKLLFVSERDSWPLPYRQLAGNESWPRGLQLLLRGSNLVLC